MAERSDPTYQDASSGSTVSKAFGERAVARVDGQVSQSQVVGHSGPSLDDASPEQLIAEIEGVVRSHDGVDEDRRSSLLGDLTKIREALASAESSTGSDAVGAWARVKGWVEAGLSFGAFAAGATERLKSVIERIARAFD